MSKQVEAIVDREWYEAPKARAQCTSQSQEDTLPRNRQLNFLHLKHYLLIQPFSIGNIISCIVRNYHTIKLKGQRKSS